MSDTITWAILVLSAIPLAMALWNRLAFRRLPRSAPDASRPGVSVLIPARNEERAIEGAVRSVLASLDVELELIVLDDGSSDRTAEIVQALARQDSRVRVVRSAPLPAAWCGKQFACHQLAGLARHDLLVWIDADVRLRPDALARLIDAMNIGSADLISGFPRQITGSLGERLLIPLIHILLVCYLPIGLSRLINAPSLAAGCGQLMVARRAAYLRAGGHAAIRASMHDGLTLPRAFRRAGLQTDIIDAHDLAECRMYASGAQTVEGLAKNATEGLATPIGIWVWTILLFGGHVAPFMLGAAWLLGADAIDADPTDSLIPALPGLGLAAMTSVFVGLWFRQPPASIALRPIAIAWLLAIQWRAWLRGIRRQNIQWKQRDYAARPASAPVTPRDADTHALGHAKVR